MGDFPGVKISSRSNAKAVKPERRSVFHITMNSNIKPKKMSEKLRMVDELTNFIEDSFASRKFLRDFIVFKVEGDSMRNVTREIEVDFGVEQGDKRGRIHAHITMVVTHNSFIRLDPKVLIDDAEYKLGYRPYVHIQSFGDPVFATRQYAGKKNLAASSSLAVPPANK